MAKPKTQTTLPGVTDRRIAALLTLLAENATIVVSGARIAREIGVSRSTVWRWVNRLRELGVPLDSALPRALATNGAAVLEAPEGTLLLLLTGTL